ncbi:uncharacterized protein LOC143631082 [Bidens hawaiensis]|uniref:uncharacterized protein LOC143631082 n=1 Tax=Bidens hawaiensis TaxID=980011 RepID=UPI00404B5106
MDVSINGGPAERMIIELFANVVPKTAENFRALCTGEKGFSKTTGKPLHYKGVVFNHINKDLFVRGGDFSDGKGLTSGESIYGGYFEDENFQLLHTERGLLSMGNIGPDTNGSEFHITFVPFSLLDR